jgi:hypothetical protein
MGESKGAEIYGYGPTENGVGLEPIDARGIPTAACPICGERWLMVPVIFDEEDYEIVSWGTEGFCGVCRALVTVCTPEDSLEAQRGL